MRRYGERNNSGREIKISFEFYRKNKEEKAFASQSTQGQSQKRTDHTTSGPLALRVMRCYCPQQGGGTGECGLRSQLHLTNSDL